MFVGNLQQKGIWKVQIRDVCEVQKHPWNTKDKCCSGSNPCDKIVLKNINITNNNNGKGYEKGETISHCSYAKVLVYGVQLPKPCISSVN